MRGAAVCFLLFVGAAVSNTGATESIKYEGDIYVKEEGGKRLIVTQGGKNKYEETIADKTYKDGLRSTIYTKDSRRKLDGKTSLILVTVEVFKNESYPRGFKVIRTVLT